MSMVEESKYGSIKAGPWEIIITERTESDDSSAGGTSSEEEDEQRKLNIFRMLERPSEYWHIQKLVKYMKTGNQTATLIALCCLLDHDLTQQTNQVAIRDIDGLEVLINLLESNDLSCKIGALTVLADLTTDVTIQRRATDLGVIALLLKNLGDPSREVQKYAAENISHCCHIRRARRIVRTSGGISKLIDCVDIKDKYLNTPMDRLTPNEQGLVSMAIAGTKALWSLSKSRKNRELIRKSGAVFLLSKLLQSVHLNIIVPTVGTIQECASDPDLQLAFRTEGMIPNLVHHLSSEESQELRCYSATAIFKCAADPISREIVRKFGGLDPLVVIIRDPNLRSDKMLIAGATGAIWNCAKSKENIKKFNELMTVNALVALLQDKNKEVLTNAVGGLGELVKDEDNRSTLRVAGGIPLLVNLLNDIWPPLLRNVPKVLRESAQEPESMLIIEELDGVRLIWSLLKHKDPEVQTNAAWALVPCIENAFDSGEMVRSFVGGLELMVKLLKCKNNKVLAAVCAALSVIAKDMENLAIITDHGVLSMFVNLITTKDDHLREYLAQAIAYSCSWGTNRKDLGRLGAITPLVTYLAKSTNPSVQRTAALALYHLSKNAFNCITMHESGVVPFLLRAMSSPDSQMQEAAAGCLQNIRIYILEAETFHLIDKGFKNEDDSDDYSIY